MPQQDNKQYEPLILVSATLAILLLLSMGGRSLHWGGFRARQVKILSDITSRAILLKALPPAFHDSYTGIARRDTSRKIAIAPPGGHYAGIIEFGTDSIGGLRCFFNALSNLGKTRKKVRVAYFGDSMIEGDLITQDLRNLFQNRFGGEGVGFMPVTSIVAGFRQSIFHTFSPDWKEYNLLDAVPADHGLGIAGRTFVPRLVDADSIQTAKTSWVKYAPVGRKRLNSFEKVYLFYGPSDKRNTLLLQSEKSLPLDGTSIVNELQLSNRPMQAFKASFQTVSPLNIYGFSMESDSGLVLDNFSFRGNSGMPLTKMPYSILTSLNKYLHYDLIVLQYGVNVVNQEVTDFSWYERGMTEVVKHLQSCFPKASILLISAGDKSTRIEGQYITDPSVPVVVEAQRRVAMKTNTAFWNFYEAMGGEGSMVKWVTGDTAFANSDYTHFNYRGANRVGTLLYNNIIREYQKKIRTD
jgi:hypothetical protein